MTAAELGRVPILPDTPPAEALESLRAYRRALAREPMGLDDYVAELAASDLERRAPTTGRTLNVELARVAKDGRGRRGTVSREERIVRGVGRLTREEQIDRTLDRAATRIQQGLSQRKAGSHG